MQEEYEPKIYGESAEGKLQSAINSIGEQSALFLMAVGDCVINKKSQAEIAKKYGIPRSWVQWAMSRKKEHKKGGKQYWQERKRKASEEGSVGSKKSKRSKGEKELEKADTRPALVTEGNDDEDNSDKLPDIRLWRTNTNNKPQSFSGPPPSSHWKYSWKALNDDRLNSKILIITWEIDKANIKGTYDLSFILAKFHMNWARITDSDHCWQTRPVIRKW